MVWFRIRGFWGCLLGLSWCWGASVEAGTIVAEDFTSGNGGWVQRMHPTFENAEFSHDGVNGRLDLEFPAAFGPQIGEIHDLASGHQVVLDAPGESVMFTVDFAFLVANIDGLTFSLLDGSEGSGEEYIYLVGTGQVYQGLGGTLSESVSTLLAADTVYSASLQLVYTGGGLDSTFTINGESFHSTRAVGGPLTLHMHLAADAGPLAFSHVYYDNVELSQIPEPSAVLMVSSGIAGLALRRRRGVTFP